jgi:D-alanyl-D-alanine carboxypeptidase
MLNRRDVFIGSSLLATGFFTAPRAAAAAAIASAGAPATLSDGAAKLIANGVSAGIALGVSQPGAEDAITALGYANLETQTPVTAETLFRIASITKQFAAVAFMRLAERGKLSPDDLLSRWFPAFPGARSIRLTQMLGHVSGIHDYVWGGLPAGSDNDYAMKPEPHRLLARMNPIADFPPGAAFNYSNSNYILLGEIIEKAAGAPFAVVLKSECFDPAGMTSAALDNNADVVRGRASGYALADGKPGAFRNCDFTTLPFAAGAIRCSVKDLLRWNAALHGGKLVSAASYARMTNAVRLNDGRPNGKNRFVPKGQPKGAPPSFITADDYGFGLQLTRMFEKPVIWHGGGISGFNSMLLYFPERKMTVVVLANTENGVVGALEPIARAGATGAGI